jgi:hypothetical protein
MCGAVSFIPFCLQGVEHTTTLLPSISDPDLKKKIINLWLLLNVEIS